MIPEQESDAGAEWTVIALLLAAAAAAVMFVLIYVLDIGHSTQFLGLALGASFGLIAAALLVVSRRLVPQENLAEDYSEPETDPEHREEQEQLLQVVRESGNRLTRRKLLGGASITAGRGARRRSDRAGGVARPGARHRLAL